MTAPRLRFDERGLREPLRRFLLAHTPRRLDRGETTASAVLVPLFDKDGETHVWLVRRPHTMRSHGGQVAFPGGKSDLGDGSLLATALRETEEELGIARADVDVLGALDDQVTGTGFTITPWVGWLARDVRVHPNPSEVARAFVAPLRAFTDRLLVSSPRAAWTVEGEFVWGATAAILRSLMLLVGPKADGQ